MGLGWNLGNQLDAHVNEIADETSWGNGKVTQETLLKVKQAGFTSVRIPVTWLGKVGEAPHYHIDTDWMNRVAEVVEYAEKAGLKAIINIHHDGHRHIHEDGFDEHRWLDIVGAAQNKDMNTAIKEQLKSMWTQIAQRFENKGEFLILKASMKSMTEDGALAPIPPTEANNMPYSTNGNKFCRCRPCHRRQQCNPLLGYQRLLHKP